MKSLLIQLDEPTLQALNRIAPAAKRQRAEFVRTAIRKAIRETEEERTRLAYLRRPDKETADDWSSAEDWKRRGSTNCGGPRFPNPPAAGRCRC